jgi:hypothetical protein
MKEGVLLFEFLGYGGQKSDPQLTKLADEARNTAYADRFLLRRDATAEQQAKAIDSFYKDPLSANFDLQKKSLIDLVHARTDKDKQVLFHKYMTEFEAKPIEQSEKARTYGQLNVLLGSEFGVISDEQRVGTALDFLFHAAEGHIDKGRHLTCAPTVQEQRTIARQPSLAAEMITSAAISGEWIARDGKTIKLDQDSLRAGPEERNYPPVDGWRSQASQIFQVVAINDFGQHRRMPLSFIQKEQSSWPLLRNMMAFAGYRGEYWRLADGREVDFGGLGPEAVAEENQRLLGDSKVVLYNAGSPESNTSDHFQPSYDPDRNPPKVIKTFQRAGVDVFDRIDGNAGLESKLADLSNNKKFPVMIGVDESNHELPGYSSWFSDLNLGSHHVVTLTEYDAEHKRVYVQNSDGSEYNGWISTQDLYNGSL